MSTTATELATFRALTFRISSTTTSQLPQHVPAIAASLANCKSLLSSTQSSNSRTSSEASVAVHKFRTLLSTLLQDRTHQGRWAAIVLIKTTVEIGGWETLHKSLPWVHGLLGVLSKPDPPSSKNLCIITLTRIFALTREYPTLVREITTPSLPTFIQSSLQIATSRAPASLLQTILESFNQLLPRHPTIFRSYLKQLQHLLAYTIAPTPSSKLGPEQATLSGHDTTSNVSIAARHLYTQLPCSAAKGVSNEEWQESLKKTIQNAHRISDKVFRAVIEDWKPSTQDAPITNGHAVDDEVQVLEVDTMSLPPWSGIFAGSERLVGLLELVTDYLECTTVGSVCLNVGLLVDLLTRLLSLTVPSSGTKGFQNTIRYNNQVSKEERENLWLILPNIHMAAIKILLALMRRGDVSTIAIDSAVLDQIVWVFASEKYTPQIRTATYLAVTQLLTRWGTTMPKSSIDPLGLMIRTCCEDLLPVEYNSTLTQQPSLANKTNSNNQQASTNADSFLGSSKKLVNPAATFGGLQEAARCLLPVLFSNIRPQFLPESLRARMERTAILLGHKDAMVASVLNQPPSKKFGKPATSILPLLARNNATENEVEPLLRPRMPVIRIGNQEGELGDEEEGEDEEPENIVEDDHFVGHELDSLLETAANTDSAGDDITMTEAAGANTPPSEYARLNDPATNIHDGTGNIAAQDHKQLESGGKRSQGDEVSLSPSKRIKVGEPEPKMLVGPIPIADNTFSTTLPGPTTEPAASTILASTVSTAPQQPNSPSPAALGKTAEKSEDNSDDDDIAPLVLGQDTDEDSD